nr:MAG TPA: hypothetical protein [Bacteriophage sp.]
MHIRGATKSIDHFPPETAGFFEIFYFFYCQYMQCMIYS